MSGGEESGEVVSGGEESEAAEVDEIGEAKKKGTQEVEVRDVVGEEQYERMDVSRHSLICSPPTGPGSPLASPINSPTAPSDSPSAATESASRGIKSIGRRRCEVSVGGEQVQEGSE